MHRAFQHQEAGAQPTVEFGACFLQQAGLWLGWSSAFFLLLGAGRITFGTAGSLKSYTNQEGAKYCFR